MIDLFELQNNLGISFTNIELLKEAFVHSSYINENPNSPVNNNERLEFLGDAILNFTTSKIVFNHFPDLSEGKLTEIRSMLIREETLADLAAGLNLGKYLLLSKGEETTGGRGKRSTLANTFESLLGAIFLDQGFETAEKFIKEQLSPLLDKIIHEEKTQNYKGKLQEHTQSTSGKLPSYRITDISGPPHNTIYSAEVLLEGKVIGFGTGKSKKLAEMEAAKSACKKLGLTG